MYLAFSKKDKRPYRQRRSSTMVYRGFYFKDSTWSTKIVCLREFASSAAYSKKWGWSSVGRNSVGNIITKSLGKAPATFRTCFLYIFPLDFACQGIHLSIALDHVSVLDSWNQCWGSVIYDDAFTSEISSRKISRSFVCSIVSKQAWTSTLTK
jgi:hypothetical protein